MARKLHRRRGPHAFRLHQRQERRSQYNDGRGKSERIFQIVDAKRPGLLLRREAHSPNLDYKVDPTLEWVHDAKLGTDVLKKYTEKHSKPGQTEPNLEYFEEIRFEEIRFEEYGRIRNSGRPFDPNGLHDLQKKHAEGKSVKTSSLEILETLDVVATREQGDWAVVMTKMTLSVNGKINQRLRDQFCYRQDGKWKVVPEGVRSDPAVKPLANEDAHALLEWYRHEAKNLRAKCLGQ